MVDTCLMCGDVIPEGRHVCIVCELTNTKELTNIIINKAKQEEQKEEASLNE